MSDKTNFNTVVVFDDIDPVFINLAKRLQQLSRYSARGLGIITVSVILYDGQPIQYTRPDVSNTAILEPKANSDKLLDKLKDLR